MQYCLRQWTGTSFLPSKITTKKKKKNPALTVEVKAAAGLDRKSKTKGQKKQQQRSPAFYSDSLNILQLFLHLVQYLLAQYYQRQRG